MPNHEFTPLFHSTDESGGSAGFRLLRLENAPGARPLAACGHAPPAEAPAPAEARPPSEPQVLLLRNGDRITGIQVRCACGAVIDLACVYDAPANSASDPEGFSGSAAPRG